MNWLKPNITWLAAGAGLLLTVALIQGLLIEGFSFDDKISIVDIANGFVTLFLAFYVPYRINRDLHSQRYELDALIEEVKLLQSNFATAWDVIQMASSPVTEAESDNLIRIFTNASSGLQGLETLARENNLEKVLPYLDKVERHRRLYKKLVTGDNFQSPDFEFDALKISLIGIAYADLRVECLRLIFQLNRS